MMPKAVVSKYCLNILIIIRSDEFTHSKPADLGTVTSFVVAVQHLVNERAQAVSELAAGVP